jgi:hypothetical protein
MRGKGNIIKLVFAKEIRKINAISRKRIDVNANVIKMCRIV